MMSPAELIDRQIVELSLNAEKIEHYGDRRVPDFDRREPA
jgi:hypothetical protein